MSPMGPIVLQVESCRVTNFLAKTRKGKRSPIRIDAIALSQSPVSLTLGDKDRRRAVRSHHHHLAFENPEHFFTHASV